ncbi:hypothetical protein OQJ59_16745, partial [Microbulbifer thermotolerans]|uniref:hypothetical protein n=1 Tax=Microbulbifer thermotolerans TaxID=252514 RepID=UPI00224B6D40
IPADHLLKFLLSRKNVIAASAKDCCTTTKLFGTIPHGASTLLTRIASYGNSGLNMQQISHQFFN